MKPMPRRRRTARKLILPLIAVGMMTVMMYLHSSGSTASRTPNAASLIYSR
jgi:hypothetical protein